MEPQCDASDDDPDASADPVAVLERIAGLRARIASPDTTPGPVLPLGVPGIDGRLPGGLGLGLPHEVAPEAAGDEAAALGFVLALVARRLAGGRARRSSSSRRDIPSPTATDSPGSGSIPGACSSWRPGARRMFSAPSRRRCNPAPCGPSPDW
ncbi:hypothetical protein [Methylobacterium gregans]|uniref:hypothetical protein n=1 Tax=Methylobacterium gregans TaxID=374424 RepID=UPI003623184F